MITAGALALTAATLLAGCGGSSTTVTQPAAASSPAAESPAPSSVAPEPAAGEPAAAEVPTSFADGLVKPADVSDENWAATTEGYTSAEEAMADFSPEEFAYVCNLPPTGQEDVAAQAEESAQRLGGSVEEWMTVWATFERNFYVLVCSRAE